jgi:hypothetical protein
VAPETSPQLLPDGMATRVQPFPRKKYNRPPSTMEMKTCILAGRFEHKLLGGGLANPQDSADLPTRSPSEGWRFGDGARSMTLLQNLASPDVGKQAISTASRPRGYEGERSGQNRSVCWHGLLPDQGAKLALLLAICVHCPVAGLVATDGKARRQKRQQRVVRLRKLESSHSSHYSAGPINSRRRRRPGEENNSTGRAQRLRRSKSSRQAPPPRASLDSLLRHPSSTLFLSAADLT